MKFYIYNDNICTRVKLFGNDVKELLKNNKWEITDDINEANYIVLNTCSFLESKSSFFLKKLKNIYDEKDKKQKIILIGCLGATHENDVLNIGKDIIIFKRELNDIKDYFNFKNGINVKSTNVEDNLSNSKKLLYYFNKYILHSKHIEYRLKRNKVCYLQISSGCRGNCTYCSEKFITKLKSRSLDEINLAIKDGIERGYTLFGLNSDDASCYGLDINCSLQELLEMVSKFKEKIYFSIPEFNPNGINKEIIKLLSNEKFLYITIPIQSGSNRILKLMKRPYKIENVIKNVKEIKKNNKNLKINTHVIVGFPGETDEDFNMTKELLSTGLFDRVKVFIYNDRPGTEASKMKNKVSYDVKMYRRDELLKVMRKINIKKFSLTNLILNREQLK